MPVRTRPAVKPKPPPKIRHRSPQPRRTTPPRAPTPAAPTTIKSTTTTNPETEDASDDASKPLDPALQKMAELCDIVKVDERRRARSERAEKARLKAEALLNPKSREITPVHPLHENGTAASSGVGGQNAPQMVLVDGRLILDVSSLQVNRQTIDHSTLELNEENSRTRLINSATYGKREKSERWGMTETDRFYEGLARFGTDFEMMRSVFPGRSRAMLKAKFKREERSRPEKVTSALRRNVPKGGVRVEIQPPENMDVDVEEEGTPVGGTPEEGDVIQVNGGEKEVMEGQPMEMPTEEEAGQETETGGEGPTREGEDKDVEGPKEVEETTKDAIEETEAEKDTSEQVENGSKAEDAAKEVEEG